MGYKDAAKQVEYQRKWIAQRRYDFFSNEKCVRCGSTERLELDHINPQDKTTHNIWSWSEERRLAEIAKCQVLCHECHLHKTYNIDLPKMRGYVPGAHGASRYSKKGCRCDVCRAGHRMQRRKERERRRLDHGCRQGSHPHAKRILPCPLAQ